MANFLNRFEFIGNAGGAVDSRFTPAGKQVSNFNVAVNDIVYSETPINSYKDVGNNFHQLTTWVKVTCWGQLAETVQTKVDKGDLVIVEGKLFGEAIDGVNQVKVWETKEGNHLASWTVTARSVKVIKKAGSNGSSVAESQVDDGPPPGFVEANEIPF